MSHGEIDHGGNSGCGWSPDQTFRCVRCDRVRCYCCGHSGDAAESCPLCDSCCVALGVPCSEPFDTPPDLRSQS